MAMKKVWTKCDQGLITGFSWGTPAGGLHMASSNLWDVTTLKAGTASAVLCTWLAAEDLADFPRNGFLWVGIDVPAVPTHSKSSPFRSALISAEVIDKVPVPIIIKGLLGQQLTEAEGLPELQFQHA